MSLWGIYLFIYLVNYCDIYYTKMSLLVTRNFGSFWCAKKILSLGFQKGDKIRVRVWFKSVFALLWWCAFPVVVSIACGFDSRVVVVGSRLFLSCAFWSRYSTSLHFCKRLERKKESKQERKCLVKGAQEDGLHLARWGVVRLRQHRCITLRLLRPCSRVAVEDRCLEAWLAPSRKEWRSGQEVPWRIEPWIPSWDRAPFSTNMHNRRDQGLQRRSRLRGPWIRVRTSPRLFRIVWMPTAVILRSASSTLICLTSVVEVLLLKWFCDMRLLCSTVAVSGSVLGFSVM